MLPPFQPYSAALLRQYNLGLKIHLWMMLWWCIRTRDFRRGMMICTCTGNTQHPLPQTALRIRAAIMLAVHESSLPHIEQGVVVLSGHHLHLKPGTSLSFCQCTRSMSTALAEHC